MQYLICYHIVIKKDIMEKLLFQRAVKIAYDNRHSLRCFLLGTLVLDNKEDIVRLKKKWDYISTKAITILPFFLGIVLFGPFFIVILGMKFLSESNLFLLIVFLLIIIFHINWNFIKEHTQKSIMLVNEFAKIIIFFEANPNFIKHMFINNHMITVNKRKKQKIAITLSFTILLLVLIYKLLDFIEINFPNMRVVLFFVAIIYFIFSHFHQKLYVQNMYKEKEKDITIKSFELEKYREDIIYLCKKLKIEDLEIDTVHELGVNAYTTIVNDSKPSIKFTYGFINALRHVSYQKGDLAMDETFRAILSHELIHIVYQDPLRIRVRARNAVLVALGFLFFILIVVSWGKFMPLILGIFIPILFLYIICFGIICDVRYWGQISELRADKKGMKVADVSEEAFDNYWEFARSIEREAAAIRRIESSNFIYKRYKRYVEIEFHPSIERRQQSLKKGANWGSYDYVEQLLLILKWKSSGKGWNGR